jgi:SNF2 family DNA or RNA helicase
MSIAYSEGALAATAAARAAWRKYQLPAAALGGGAKMAWLRTALASAVQRGSRIALFSQFTSVLDIIETALAEPGLMSDGVTRTCRLDGSTPVAERQHQLDTFENDATILVMLLSTRAGGVGINLTSADTVVIFDCDWNPQNDVQAEDRCYRLGQTRPVNVYRLLVRGTIEVHLSSIAEGKRGIADSLLELSEISPP